jgi:hypothetical protein
MAESMLNALEGSLRLFEEHRIFFAQLQRIISPLAMSGSGVEPN